MCNNEKIVNKIITLLKANNQTISTAESCTGGGIAKEITNVSGASQCFKGGVVAYSEEIKHKLLNVNIQTIEKYNVVSKQVAVEMMKGACKTLNTTYAIATTGIAGPSGGTMEIEVGTIWIAIGNEEKYNTFQLKKDEGRLQNTANAIAFSLKKCMEMLEIQANFK